MDLKFKRVRFGGSHYRKVGRLYHQAFPPVEQLSLWLLSVMSLRSGLEFYAVYDGEDFCGLLYLNSDRDHSLIFYFAVDSELRDKGYGTQILSWIKRRKSSVSVIMESIHEPCDNLELRLRRKGFYLRNGFQDTPYYMKGREGWFDILSTDPEIDPGKYGKLILRLMFSAGRDIIGRF